MATTLDSRPTTGQPRGAFAVFARRNPTIVLGAALLALMAVVAVAAPWIAGDPLFQAPVNRLKAPSAQHWFGTDHLGRDVYSRAVFGSRISLVVGITVATISILIGLVIGLAAGYFRRVDGIVMRFMDGLMAIPGILLAIAMVALTGASIVTVIVAIVIPEIPRVVRLVRAVVLSAREQPYVDAAVSGGSRSVKIIHRHILPNTFAPLIVQATYICASAILVEAALSFLGAGIPPQTPTWGNMIAQSRINLRAAPWTIFFPGAGLAIVVLAVNLLGDGLRDRLDPRIARRM
ncbi:MAG: ABC transporter permease [Alphaproteobacteria bacterium]|nr:ABC transporter permease [Alphaproteobacteria bacterium]